jgi:hypothetical protein
VVVFGDLENTALRRRPVGRYFQERRCGHKPHDAVLSTDDRFARVVPVSTSREGVKIAVTEDDRPAAAEEVQGGRDVVHGRPASAW